MVLHGMVRYCMVLYGTVPMVLHGNNCMVLYALSPKQTSFNPMHQTFFSMMVPSFSHYFSSFLFTEKSKRAKFPCDINFDFLGEMFNRLSAKVGHFNAHGHGKTKQKENI